MRSPLRTLSLLFVIGVMLTPNLKASMVTFSYATNPDPEPPLGITVTGNGSFSYNGPLTTINLGDITGFNFQMTFATQTNPNPVFNWGTADLLSFSATVSGGVVTSLSLQTDFQFASNTNAYLAERLTVHSLAIGGADNDTQNSLNSTIILVLYNGTVTTQGPGNTPEPSTAILVGGLGLVAVLRYKVFRRRNREMAG